MQSEIVSHPISLFCAATLADATFLIQWETHLLILQQAGHLTFWSEQHLQAGKDRAKQKAAHLAQADYLILLLSADFFADDDCLTLMHEALQKHLRIIPLLVRPFVWLESPLRDLPCLPSNGTAITSWSDRDAGWHQAIQDLQHQLELVSSRALVPPNKHRGVPSLAPISPQALPKETQPRATQQSQRKTRPLKPFSRPLLLRPFLLFLALLALLGVVSSVVYPHMMHPSVPPLASPTRVSTLIPPKGQLVVDDPLNKADDPFQWKTEVAGGLQCRYEETGLHLSASKGTSGNGCSPQFPSTNAHLANFVYQIQMVINQGGSDLKTGPTFCWDKWDGYRLDFGSGGGWNLFFGDQSIRTGISSYFQDIGQMNTITVRVTKNQMDAQVNGYMLFSLRDPQQSEGQIGVNLDPGGEKNADVTFTHAKVWLF